MLVLLHIYLIVWNPCTWRIHPGKSGFHKIVLLQDPELDTELSQACSLLPHRKDWPCHVSCWKHRSRRASRCTLSLLYPLAFAGFSPSHKCFAHKYSCDICDMKISFQNVFSFSSTGLPCEKYWKVTI